MNRKKVCVVVLAVMVIGRAGSGGAGCGAAPALAASRSSTQVAEAASELLKLLPRSMDALLVIDPKRLMEIDVVVKAMQNPTFKQDYDEIVQSSGIDPQRDFFYVGFAFRLSSLTAAFEPKHFGIVIKLKYDRGYLQALLKGNPEAKEKKYRGVSLYAVSTEDQEQADPAGPPQAASEPLFMVLLDKSHILIGDEPSVKSIIDVTKRQAEALAKNPDMVTLVSRTDMSGLGWGAAALPAEIIQKLVVSKPAFTPLKGLRGLSLAFDDTGSKLQADLRTLGGTKDQNATMASTLIGLKTLGANYAAQEPEMGELMNGIAVTSGEDYTRLILSMSYALIEKLMALGKQKPGETSPDPDGAGAGSAGPVNERSEDRPIKRRGDS
jgi:hypothetical protein